MTRDKFVHQNNKCNLCPFPLLLLTTYPCTGYTVWGYGYFNCNDQLFLLCIIPHNKIYSIYVHKLTPKLATTLVLNIFYSLSGRNSALSGQCRPLLLSYRYNIYNICIFTVFPFVHSIVLTERHQTVTLGKYFVGYWFFFYIFTRQVLLISLFYIFIIIIFVIIIFVSFYKVLAEAIQQ